MALLTGVFAAHPQERVIYGQPAAGTVRAEAERLGARRVFVTSTASLANAADGPLRKIVATLGEICVGCSSAIPSHSPLSAILAGAAAARHANADLLVAVGGGSVIDATKAMLICLWEGLETTEAVDAHWAAPYRRRPEDLIASGAIRMIAVSTTLSAAEFTPNAGVTDERAKIKQSFFHPLCVPRIAILDPAATMQTPLWLLAATGLRAVDHAVESWCSPTASPATEPHSWQGFRLLLSALPAILAEPQDLTWRQQAQFGMWQAIAAATAGAGTGASHGIGYVLGGTYGLPHGHTSAIMLPAVLAWNETVNAERQRALLQAIGTSSDRLYDVIAALVERLGLPRRLRDAGISQSDLPVIAQHALRYPAVRRNPRPIRGAEDVLEILKLAW